MAAATDAKKLTGKKRDTFIKIAARFDCKDQGEREAALHQAYRLLQPLEMRLQDALLDVYGVDATPQPAPQNDSARRELEREIAQLKSRETELRRQIVSLQLIKKNSPGMSLEGAQRIAQYEEKRAALDAMLGTSMRAFGELEAARFADMKRWKRERTARYDAEVKLSRRVKIWRCAAFAVPLGLCLAAALFVLVAVHQAKIDMQHGTHYLREQQERENVLGMQVLSLEQKLAKLQKNVGPRKVAAR